jgi:hypothetical protein
MSKLNYSTRDYITLLSEINQDPVLQEQPTFFKTFMAGIFDVLNNTINACMNAILPEHFYSRVVAQKVLQLLDYNLGWKQTSTCLATLEINPSATVVSDYTILKSELKFSSVGTQSLPPRQYESREDVTFTTGTFTTSIRLYQQETRPQVILGTTSGSSFQTFDLPDQDVLRDTLEITINSITYSRVDTFAGRSALEYVYKLYYRADGSSYIEFGGIDPISSTQFGFIPTAGFDVFANYAVGGGANSNTGVGTITQYLGQDANFVSITNVQPATGGRNEETLVNAGKIAPLRARSAEYFINTSSGEALAKSSIENIQTIQVRKAGILTASVWVIPNGGGIPSAGLKTSIKELLESRSLLEEVTVNVFDPNYVPIDINVQVRPKDNADPTLVERYSKFALVHRVTENGEYILEVYQSNGIDKAIEIINALYTPLTGDTYGISDYTPISLLLDVIRVTNFGRDLRRNDLVSTLAFVDGVDFVNVITPTTDTIVSDGNTTSVNSLGVSII